jgi:NADPH:quinone reductase-like Zn-dependent oxidoreductase
VIYGASSSVGSYAVQLAKLSGFYVVGIAGAGSEYAKSVGADVVIDYRGKDSSTLVQETKAALENRGEFRYICM